MRSTGTLRGYAWHRTLVAQVTDFKDHIAIHVSHRINTSAEAVTRIKLEPQIAVAVR